MFAGARAGLEFRDEVKRSTRRAGGGSRNRGDCRCAPGRYDSGRVERGVDPVGPIVDIARRLDPAVDVVVSARTPRLRLRLGAPSRARIVRQVSDRDDRHRSGVARCAFSAAAVIISSPRRFRRTARRRRFLRGTRPWRKDCSASWDGWAPRSPAGSTPMENRRSASSSRTPTSRPRRPPAP